MKLADLILKIFSYRPNSDLKMYVRITYRDEDNVMIRREMVPVSRIGGVEYPIIDVEAKEMFDVNNTLTDELGKDNQPEFVKRT